MRVLQDAEGDPSPGGSITALTYSPGGSLLAAVGRELTIWDLSRGSVWLRSPLKPGSGRCAAFSPDGGLLAVANGGTSVLLWDVEAGRVDSILWGHTRPVVGLGFLPGGPALVSGASGEPGPRAAGEIGFWRAGSAAIETRAIDGEFWALAVSPKGDSFAVGVPPYAIRVFEIPGPVQRRWLVCGGILGSVPAFSPEGRFLSAATIGGGVPAWELASGRSVAVLGQGQPRWGTSVAFSPDGSTLAVGNSDGSVRFWDLATRKGKAVFDWGFDNVQAVAFSPDGSTCAAGGMGKVNLVVWDVDG